MRHAKRLADARSANVNPIILGKAERPAWFTLLRTPEDDGPP